MNAINELSFESAYQEIERLMTQLESADISLEDSVTLFERGKYLIAHCQKLIDQAELRVTNLNIKPPDAS